MTDIRQSPQWAKYLTNLGWIVERINNTNYAIRKIPLLGAVLKIQRPDKVNSKTISFLAKKYHAFQVVFTPLSTVSVSTVAVAKNHHISSYQTLPSKTIQLDLTKTEPQLLAGMHYKTRYNIKKTQKLRLQVLHSRDIETFIRLYHRWHRRRLFFLSQAKLIRNVYQAFGKRADLLFCTHNAEIIAELLLLSYDKSTYYMYAAASEVGKKLFAPTLITWAGIKLAKQHGSRIFDFEGIYDDRYPIKSWRGFTRFKKSFGGKEVLYPITK